MALPEDVIAKVRQDFSEDDSLVILQLLSEFQKQEPELSGSRILRCIVFLANGSYDEFSRAVELARVDWRDLIAEAEYDGWSGEEHRLRNFNLPFPS